MPASTQPRDGVRICKSKDCHSPIPTDSRYATCDGCRDKRRRERELQEREASNGFHTFRLDTGYYGGQVFFASNTAVPPAPWFPNAFPLQQPSYSPTALPFPDVLPVPPVPPPPEHSGSQIAPEPPTVSPSSDSPSRSPSPKTRPPRLCTQKKCRKPIPDDYEFRTCETCRNRKRSEHKRARARTALKKKKAAELSDATTTPSTKPPPVEKKKRQARKPTAVIAVSAAERARMASLIRQMGGVPAWEREGSKDSPSTDASVPATTAAQAF